MKAGPSGLVFVQGASPEAIACQHRAGRRIAGVPSTEK